ncbi:uncharacterized protein [Ptychodera flava]|uniref:uncharacterized protein n=1 Tax=Ptychodera flava TaxID=63121 RepID=UPI00396A37DF
MKRNSSHFVWFLLVTALAQLTAAQRFYDCQDVYDSGITTSGIYAIYPISSPAEFNVSCDMNVNEGIGWTVIERRVDGQEDFNRTWIEYRQGFGDLESSHWLGNDRIHSLSFTNGKKYEARIELTDAFASIAVAVYDDFSIRDNFDFYELNVGAYIGGNAGDSLSYQSGRPFSTYDAPNDGVKNVNYGERHGGGWWFDVCPQSNLNGLYYTGNGNYESLFEDGIMWKSWRGDWYSYRSVTIKLRPTTSTSVNRDEKVASRPNSKDVCRSTKKNERRVMEAPRYYDCQDLANKGYDTDGLYEVWPEKFPCQILVPCEFHNGEGWLVFQRRVDGAVDFYLRWQDYKDGFGDVFGDFWLGNDLIFNLTSTTRVYQLRVDLENLSGDWAHVIYATFRIEDEELDYTLRLGPFIEGDADDSFKFHDGKRFTTRDRDNDECSPFCNCADWNNGGWWYHDCYDCVLNGRYPERVLWKYGGQLREHKTSVMKIRPTV